MRISPFWLTIILAVLTGVLVFAIWIPISGYFYPPGTPEGGNTTTVQGHTNATDSGSEVDFLSFALFATHVRPSVSAVH